MSRKRFSIWRVLRNVVVLLLLGALALAGYLYTEYRAFADVPIPGVAEKTQIDVPLGAPLTGVVALMRQQGINPGPSLYWRILARQLGVAGHLHAGEYALEAGLTPRALLRKMAAGEVIQHKFTIVEGWTFVQMRLALYSARFTDKALKVELASAEPEVQIQDQEVMSRLGEPDVPPEGLFLPETYSYVKGMSDLDIMRRAREAMKKTLDKLWAERSPDTPLKSPYEALILASIVEKETARADERPKIARVFLSRLKLGMKLQTDPTVIYGKYYVNHGGIVNPDEIEKINITRSDLDTDTPYNTYTRTGLPPTPIALPGQAALAAVIHPAETNALYFVARGDGAHEFSATLDAHNRAVAKYQLHRK
ncbi:MAG TPA: endolytic transglycosylase MltG [Rudaea sp.]|uniref:endolytic transglycosylase MltG n=1 Tax=Rudaea sp. TaxID=2136325 RepID=UPI002F95C2A8